MYQLTLGWQRFGLESIQFEAELGTRAEVEVSLTATTGDSEKKQRRDGWSSHHHSPSSSSERRLSMIAFIASGRCAALSAAAPVANT